MAEREGGCRNVGNRYFSFFFLSSILRVAWKMTWPGWNTRENSAEFFFCKLQLENILFRILYNLDGIIRKEENRERKERLCNDSEIEVMNKYSNESIGYLEINWKGKGGDSFDSSVWVLNCRWKGKKEKNSINIRTDDNLHYHRDSNLLKKK